MPNPLGLSLAGWVIRIQSMVEAAIAHDTLHAAGRRACILGTAGHIDHGKSSLVKALTGTDPDRLPEEKARGMTIELGFAHLTLPDADGIPDALQVGIVDVPGHERFVRTMVAGATGIDMAMLVVAADDGVMPQTREHVDILGLLGIERGVVALSKIDLVSADRAAVVRRQLAELTASTPLAGWPVAEVSSRTGAGLDALRRAIAACIATLPAEAATDIFRLAIDRVFAIHGRGTVITGSVLSGKVGIGDVLELMPSGTMCKVREVQSHGMALPGVAAGRRAALNLTGVNRAEIERGMELATPGYLTPARYVDAVVQLIGRTWTTGETSPRLRDKPLHSHQRVRVCIGTRDVTATAVLLDAERLTPGESATLQLRFMEPVVAAFGQRFILRNENSQSTLGGGRVVRPVSRRMRLRDAEERKALARAMSSNAGERCEQAVRDNGFIAPNAVRLACRAGVGPAEARVIVDQLRADAMLVTLAPGRETHRDVVANIERRSLVLLLRHHAAHPLEPGILRDRFIGWLEKRSDSALARVLASRMESGGKLVVRGPYVAHADFRPALSAEDSSLLDQLVSEVAAAGFDPPAWSALKTIAPLSKQRARVLEEIAKTEPRLVPFGPQQYISREAMEKLKQVVRELGAGRSFKLAEVRDAIGASRRVVQPLLEHLDRIQFTRRVGDERVLTEKQP